MAAHFNYADEEEKSFINERLKGVCNNCLDLNALEGDKDYKMAFRILFREPQAAYA